MAAQKKLSSVIREKAELPVAQAKARMRTKAVPATVVDDRDLAASHAEKKAAWKQQPPNTIKTARENLTSAFELMGGVPAFVRWGKKNPTEFYRIWARLVPREAVEGSTAMPLEDLLAQLATKSEKTVAEAAFEIGAEVIEQGRIQSLQEDAEGRFLSDGTETVQ